MGISANLFKYIHKSKVSDFEGIPGPIPSFPLGNLSSFIGATPWETIAGMRVNFGDICLVWFKSASYN